jgi:hypothetical protein
MLHVPDYGKIASLPVNTQKSAPYNSGESSMTTKTTFTARPYGGEADLQAICDMLNACDAVDQNDDNYAVDD